MKKLLVVLVLLALTGCSSEVKDAPLGQLKFSVEDDPNYVGSYAILRENAGEEWWEWGEWTPFEATFGREVVCFGYFAGTGTFSARSDYEWVQVKYQGRGTKCLELQKRSN